MTIIDNGHESVSNLPEETNQITDGDKNEQTCEPGQGKESDSHDKENQEYESVEGFTPTDTSRIALETAYTAPDTSSLPDIAEASFGPLPPMQEIVHGQDDRVRINNTASYPWRVHASLLITARDGSRWIGTAWFIGPHTLITAGHVVYIKGSNVPGRDGWVRSINVMPGRNGSSLPYGTVTSSNLRSVTGWTNSGNQNYDYGAIIIPNNLGNTTGWLGFGSYSDSTLTNSFGNISGYPGDKPSGTQWYDGHRIASVNSRKVYYDIDTAGGQSGSAVYRIVNGNRYGFAVHAYGGRTTNSGTRITRPVFDNMVNWKS